MMNLPYQIDLSGKTAVVTSDGGYLCRTFSMALALCGAKVAVLDYQKSDADEFADEIIQMGGTALGITADMLEPESMKEARALVARQFGPCDILVNAARGTHPLGMTTKEYFYIEDLAKQEDVITFFDLDPGAAEDIYRKNFITTLIATQVFARDMIGRTGGVVINISSLNAIRPLTKIMAYSAAKASISSFTQWLAVHLSKVGIRVNAIAPGFVITPQSRPHLTNPDGSFIPRVLKELSQTPMERMAEPDELVGTLLWLVDGRASGFVTGMIIPIDGGFTAYSGV